MTEQPTFDPRFDPAFQRGYVPPAKAPTVLPTPVTADTIGELSVGVELTEPKLPEGAAATGEVPGSFVRRGVNPYVVTLWVIGIVFTLAGPALSFVGYFMMMTNLTSEPAQIAAIQALYAFGSVFGVPLLTVGLATIAGLIFFSAWRSWRRREGAAT